MTKPPIEDVWATDTESKLRAEALSPQEVIKRKMAGCRVHQVIDRLDFASIWWLVDGLDEFEQLLNLIYPVTNVDVDS